MDSPSGKKLLACMASPCMTCGYCPNWNCHKEGNTMVYTAHCRSSTVFHSLDGHVHHWHRGRLCECRYDNSKI